MELFKMKDVWCYETLHYEEVRLQSDKMTFLCGKSGTGKSTLFRLLNATVSKDRGEIEYCGKAIEEYETISLRREVLLVSQALYLYEESIEKNFEHFYGYLNRPVPCRDEIEQFLHICEAPFPLSTDCRQLSGGERQRVFLAIHLSMRPKVLLLDEPTSALDEVTAENLMGNLKAYCKEQNITPIVITHSKALMEKYADAIWNLDREESHE